MPLLSGVVKTKSGQPVSGAAVAFVSAPTFVPEIALLTAQDGSFQLNAPAPGLYVLGANHPEAGSGHAQVEVGAAGIAGVEICLMKHE